MTLGAYRNAAEMTLPIEAQKAWEKYWQNAGFLANRFERCREAFRQGYQAAGGKDVAERADRQALSIRNLTDTLNLEREEHRKTAERSMANASTTFKQAAEIQRLKRELALALEDKAKGGGDTINVASGAQVNVIIDGTGVKELLEQVTAKIEQQAQVRKPYEGAFIGGSLFGHNES